MAEPGPSHPQFQGRITVDIREAEPDWAPYRAATAPAGAPNVLYLRHVVQLTFTRTAAIDGGLDVIGDALLTVDGDPVGEYPRLRMAGLDLMQAVSVGRSVVYPVSAAYKTPAAFTGGGIGAVTLDFDGTGLQHAGAVTEVAFARD